MRESKSKPEPGFARGDYSGLAGIFPVVKGVTGPFESGFATEHVLGDVDNPRIESSVQQRAFKEQCSNALRF